MTKNQQKQLRQNKYTFEFIDGSQFIINGEPNYIKEILKYPGLFVIIKNKIDISGYIKKVIINEICY